MAKRVRGQRTSHRPGGVGPARPDRDAPTTKETGSSGTAPAIVPPSPAADEVVATSVGSSAAVVTATSRSAVPPRELRLRTKLRSSGLDQKAAAETEWVTDDLRRIAVISAIMLVGLALAWVLLVVVGLGDFY